MKLPAGVVSQPARQFDGADIVALAMMGTALANKYSISVAQPVNRGRTAAPPRQAALYSGRKVSKTRSAARRAECLLRLCRTPGCR